MNMLVKLSLYLLIFSGLAWGIEAFEINIFDTLLGSAPPIVETIADLLMGVAAIIVIIDLLQKK